MGHLERRSGGMLRLRDCHGRMDWPQRGVYFFFEEGQVRSDTGSGLRVVRVGTHALITGSSSTLWKRLAQHRGTASGKGGNHRGSIFRLLAGDAIRTRDGLDGPVSWGVGNDPGKAAAHLGLSRAEILDREAGLEAEVSKVIGDMQFLWLAIDDDPGPDSLRGLVERNSIALLSNAGKAFADAPSADWLGLHCSRKQVRASGLWNNNHVEESYASAFLDDMERLILE